MLVIYEWSGSGMTVTWQRRCQLAAPDGYSFRTSKKQEALVWWWGGGRLLLTDGNPCACMCVCQPLCLHARSDADVPSCAVCCVLFCAVINIIAAGALSIVEVSHKRVKFAAGAYVGTLETPEQMAVFLYYLDVSKDALQCAA